MSSETLVGRTYGRVLAAGDAEARAALGRAAEQWGAEWLPAEGTLHLPLSAGLRAGFVSCQTRLAAAGAATEVTLTVGAERWFLRRNAVAVLVIGALGGGAALLWPLWPGLTPLAPLGAVLVLTAWFLVISRLTTNTPDDFLRLVDDELAGDGGAD